MISLFLNVAVELNIHRAFGDDIRVHPPTSIIFCIISIMYHLYYILYILHIEDRWKIYATMTVQMVER
jgi:heme/copper-type cytochrome/quinol oxidase subunit 4